MISYKNILFPKEESKKPFSKRNIIILSVLTLIVLAIFLITLTLQTQNNHSETDIKIRETILEQKTPTPNLENTKKPDPPTELAKEKNLLIWEKYGIRAPIIYASMEDLFEKNSDGSINYQKPIDNNPIDSPIQKKLTKGVVHLPTSPLPGEIGNSYIIGHSSNYSNVDSKYNEVFKPLIKKVALGEKFQILNQEGKNLTFNVFETLEVHETEVEKAFKTFGNKRVITLQGSILENINGNWLPTKRYLVRGELEIDNS